VSRTRAVVTLKDLRLMNHLHENLFERAGGAGDGFDFAVLGAQKIDCLIGLFAAGKNEFDVAVARGGGAGPSAESLLQALGHRLGFNAIAAAGSQILDFSFKCDAAVVDDGNVAAE